MVIKSKPRSRSRRLPAKKVPETLPEPKREPEPESDIWSQTMQLFAPATVNEDKLLTAVPTTNESEELREDAAASTASRPDELKTDFIEQSRDDQMQPPRATNQAKVKGSHSDLVKEVKKHGELKQKREKAEKEVTKYENIISHIEQEKVKAIKKIKALSNKFDLANKYDLIEIMDHVEDESVAAENMIAAQADDPSVPEVQKTAQADDPSVPEVQKKSIPVPAQPPRGSKQVKVKGSHSDWAKEIKKVAKLDQKQKKVEKELKKCKNIISVTEQKQMKSMEYIKALSNKFNLDDGDD